MKPAMFFFAIKIHIHTMDTQQGRAEALFSLEDQETPYLLGMLSPYKYEPRVPSSLAKQKAVAACWSASRSCQSTPGAAPQTRTKQAKTVVCGCICNLSSFFWSLVSCIWGRCNCCLTSVSICSLKACQVVEIATQKINVMLHDCVCIHCVYTTVITLFKTACSKPNN